MNLAPQIELMRQLIADYEAAGLVIDPRAAREAAYQMLHVVTVLFNTAYRADLEKMRREGKTL